MTLSPDSVLWSALAVTMAYTVFGLTGFGASMAAMPLLAHFFPLRFAVPMMLVFDLCAGFLIGWRNHAVIDKSEVKRLVPFMLFGIALGATLLVKAPEGALLLSLGCFVLAYAAYNFLFRPGGAPIVPLWSAPLGTLGGMFSALFGAGGPIYAIYLARRLPEKSVLRATVSSVIMLSSLSRLFVFIAAGLYAQRHLLVLALALVPCALLGLFIGNRLHHRLPARHVVQAVWVLLVVGGASLIRRGLAAI